MKALLGNDKSYIVRLTLSLDVPYERLPPATPNTYLLSTTQDVLDWDKSEWFYTPCKSFANFTELRTLPPVSLEARTQQLAANVTQATFVYSSAPPRNPIVFFVHVRLVDASGFDVLPAVFTDNFFSLKPTESLAINITYDAAAHPDASVVYLSFNEQAGAASAAAAPSWRRAGPQA
jgi:exo-1,4-beta-D-glucosaminidase